MNLSGHQGRTEFLGEEQSCAKARCLISSAVRQVSRAAEGAEGGEAGKES